MTYVTTKAFIKSIKDVQKVLIYPPPKFYSIIISQSLEHFSIWSLVYQPTTYQDTTTDESSHVLYFVSNMFFFDILGAPVRKEEQNVAEDGQKNQGVQRDRNEKGALSSTHVVCLKTRRLQQKLQSCTF